MKTLRNIFDNVTHSSDKWEPYFEIYERHLTPFRGKEINFVEVGVQKGGSLEMWSDFFGSQAKIIGVDVDEECKNLKYDQTNIEIIIGNQENANFWKSFLNNNSKIDIFVDDGGHTMQQQIITFESIFPNMPIGSVYICEDCHTSYMPHFGGGLNNSNTFIEYAKGYVDVLHYDYKDKFSTTLENKFSIGKNLTGLYFYDSVVVFEKFGKRRMERVFPKL